MTRPTKFEIMRINRGCGGYLNHKAQLLGEMDCAEFDVLRDLRRRQRKEHEESAMPTTQPMPQRTEDMVKLAAAIRARSPRRRPWWKFWMQFWRPAWL
jgi:hypothetical protein